MSLARITTRLVQELDALTFTAPVTHVYNPLVYARAPWNEYCRRYGTGRREILLVGMNPGPFGMAQVGVPFGEVTLVRDFLGIDGRVGTPPHQHPKRPILGFACTRSEVSGARFWGWARDRFATPQRFFARFFVANYCPLVFMSASGANLTPDKLPAATRRELFAICDRALAATVAHFAPRLAIGVGAFAHARLVAALGATPPCALGSIPHPSPASPQANRGWSSLADRALADLGVDV